MSVFAAERGQTVIQDDLLRIGDGLKRLADQRVPMLVICGLYQLFGHFFQTKDGERIRGIGLFDIETYGGDKRMIGNIVTRTAYGDLIGYENHSGVTMLDNPADALGNVMLGAGNNKIDGTEGCRITNVFGTYSHGPVLAKNPVFADLLLDLALERKYGPLDLQPLDDTLENLAHETAASRPR